MEMNLINSTHGSKEPAVIVKNACKKYGAGNVVLNGLDMTVPEGTIYGLLGPSGCGKSTLLHSIIGRHKLDSGVIKVKANTIADIGFMPQEISLYEEFSIIETTTYYGRIFGLSDYQIGKRTDELLELLELPPKSRVIRGLSGGQNRRVSFAVALLHDPKLLILDEPTVGVDPMLCVSIWDKLLLMVENENKTVIITTHYIEETRRAHNIALMRDGILLAEDSPSQLMTQYNSSTLEEVFLQLCQRQHASSKGRKVDEWATSIYPMPKSQAEVPLKKQFSCSWPILMALLTKNFYWMKRNTIVVLFILMAPFWDSLFYSLCVGNDPTGLKLAVVNEELPEISNCDSFALDSCNFSVPFSCRYMKKLQQKSYELVQYYNIDDGKHAVKKNQAWGLIHFPKNYTNFMYQRIVLREKADDVALTLSEVQVWLDMSNQYISYQLKKDTLKECVDYLQELFFDCGWPAHLADLPIEMENAIYGKNEPKFRHTTTLSIASLLHFHFPMISTMAAVLMEKMTGSLDRSLISGVTLLEVTISILIIQSVFTIIQSTLMMFVLFVMFDTPLLVEKLVFILPLLYSTGASGMFYGFMIGAFCETDKAATYMALGTTFGCFYICGILWPLEGMHWIIRSISYIMPITRCAEAFRALSVKGWPLSNSTVYQGFFSSFVWSCIFILITWAIVKKNNGLGSK